MYYHASQINNIKTLEPKVSNHNKPLIYFSDKRENVLVYLSNAIEKYCKETNFKYDGVYSKWGPYSFTNDGKLQLEEYYPNAIYETYSGVSAYIYHVKDIPNKEKLKDIPHVFVTYTKTLVDSIEYIEDAYTTIIDEANKGNITIVRYDEFIKNKEDWLKKTIIKEYNEAINHPEYRYFLKAKFKFLNDLV